MNLARLVSVKRCAPIADLFRMHSGRIPRKLETCILGRGIEARRGQVQGPARHRQLAWTLVANEVKLFADFDEDAGKIGIEIFGRSFVCWMGNSLGPSLVVLSIP